MPKPYEPTKNATLAVRESTSKQKAQWHRTEIMGIYRQLLRTYGPQHWWPGQTAFEVIVGAILTQNTAWKNVEKAIANLKRSRLLTPAAMHNVSEKRLAALIRPSGYFNIKAGRLKSFTRFLYNEYRGSLQGMFKGSHDTLREKLICVKGIGPETADSILLYAGGYPTFVADAYTRRVFSRHGFVPEEISYDALKRYFMDRLSPDAVLFNEYHALIVKVGKERCRKAPLCVGCPLETFLNDSSGINLSSKKSKISLRDTRIISGQHGDPVFARPRKSVILS